MLQWLRNIILQLIRVFNTWISFEGLKNILNLYI